MERWTKKEISYALRVAKDALKAEGRKGKIRIGYAHYSDGHTRRVIVVTGSNSPCGTWTRVDRRINYRLSRNWGKYFLSPCPRTNGNYISEVVAEEEA